MRGKLLNNYVIFVQMTRQISGQKKGTKNISIQKYMQRRRNMKQRIISILLAVGLIAGTWDMAVLAQDASLNDTARVAEEDLPESEIQEIGAEETKSDEQQIEEIEKFAGVEKKEVPEAELQVTLIPKFDINNVKCNKMLPFAVDVKNASQQILEDFEVGVAINDMEGGLYSEEVVWDSTNGVTIDTYENEGKEWGSLSILQLKPGEIKRVSGKIWLGDVCSKPTYGIIFADVGLCDEEGNLIAEGEHVINIRMVPACEDNKHTCTTQVTAATLSGNGYTIKRCTVCGDIISQSTIYYPKAIALSSTDITYNGKVQTPSVTVKGSDGKVIHPSNYTVSYSPNRKKIGHYTVTITFKGNYSGTVVKTFNINPKGTKLSKVKAAKKKATVKWKKQTKDTKGYQVQYSMDKSFKSGVKTKTVSGSKKTSVTLKGMKSRKTYYVRIRTYQNASGGKCYSSWSGAKKVKIK